MIGARYCSDYYYINHSNKSVCFNFKFTKRVKTKVLNFLKTEHEESKIKKYVNELGLELVKVTTSKKYIHYEIIEK